MYVADYESYMTRRALAIGQRGARNGSIVRRTLVTAFFVMFFVDRKVLCRIGIVDNTHGIANVKTGTVSV